jgi:hypothetical protein
LILLFGDNNRLILENISSDQIDIIRDRLKNAGIDLIVNTEVIDMQSHRQPVHAMHPYIIRPNDSCALEDIKLVIATANLKHYISFKLLRTPIPTTPKSKY